MNDKNLEELSAAELRTMVQKMQEQMSQKDRQISHLTRNAQKWVKKFDDDQSNVADSVIKKFEQEFEHERNELHAKLAKLTQLNSSLITRYRKLEKSVIKAAPKIAVAMKDESKRKNNNDELTAQDIQISLLAEPASITEIEFSNEMKEKLAKYAS